MSKIDRLLQEHLKADCTPPQDLNCRIIDLYTEKGQRKMKKSGIKKALVAACLAVLCAIPAYAAVKLLAPSQVAKHMGDDSLSQAFRIEGSMEETQESGGYKVTFLGTVSGQNLSDNDKINNSEIRVDKTYCVVAIQKADGTPFENITDMSPTFVSPYIEGCNPIWVNIASLEGGFVGCLVDGVIYRIINCENLEPFADRTVYLGVSEGGLYNREAYIYDEESGKMSRNPDYAGLNALFEVNLDPSKADSRKAEELLKSFNLPD